MRTICAWNRSYYDMEAPDARRLKAREPENAKLMRIFVTSMIEIDYHKCLLSKIFQGHDRKNKRSPA